MSSVDLEDRVIQLERDLDAVARFVPDGRGEHRGGAVQDSMWRCCKCSTLLAYYDPDKDVLRMRYKDHVMFARVGGADAAGIAGAVAKYLREELSIDLADEKPLEELIAASTDLGFVQVICRGCSEVNTEQYASRTEVEQVIIDEMPPTQRRRAR